ncbi:molecular chaperone DnaJ [Candidatus Falkowbacteria bacterium]|nr:molecular chaperone DnaJ [Candidatus Falkowbacteria bacterium]
MGKDYYKILGCEKGANADEIKQAFRKLAHKYHPDKQGGSEAKFKEINEAYQVLGNADKRRQYDQFGATFDQQGGFGGGMNWDDFMRQAREGFSAQGGGGFGNIGFDFGGLDLGDIFGDIFGFNAPASGRRRRPSARRGEDIAIDLQLDFKEAVFGTSREIKLNRKILCPACGGKGKEPGTNFVNCAECGGHGQVTRVQRTFLGTMQTSVTCSKCGGAGKIPEKKCKRCSGIGFVNEVQNLKIEIPAGVNNGDTLELAGHGNAASGGTGSLYVNVFVKPSREFERDGWNIISHKKINAFQAMLGDVIDVETVDGTVELKIPEGTQAGALFRLRGKGVKHGSFRGDQLVEVEVEIPCKLSRKARQLLKEINDELI